MYVIISSFYLFWFYFFCCETLIEDHSCLGMRLEISACAYYKVWGLFFWRPFHYSKIPWTEIHTLWSTVVISRQPSTKYWPLVHYLFYRIIHMIHQEPGRNSLLFLASTQSSLMYFLRSKFNAEYCKDFRKCNAIKSFCTASVFIKSYSLSNMYLTASY